jgi:SAM-dependent methyltransferase
MIQNTMPAVARYWNAAAGEFDEIYGGAGKNKFTHALDCFFRRDIYQRFDWVIARVGDMHGKTVCDIGCGSGRFVAEFARGGAQSVLGVDVAPEMIKRARGLVVNSGLDQQCEFVTGDILDFRADRVSDISIAIDLWDYVADPGERFLSAWPRFFTWRMPVRKLRLQYLRGCPVYFFRRNEVRRLLEQAGFEILTFETVGKLFCVDARPR